MHAFSALWAEAFALLYLSTITLKSENQSLSSTLCYFEKSLKFES